MEITYVFFDKLIWIAYAMRSKQRLYYLPCQCEISIENWFRAYHLYLGTLSALVGVNNVTLTQIASRECNESYFSYLWRQFDAYACSEFIL